MVVPVRGELVAGTADLGARLVGGLARLVDRRRSELRAAARALPTPERLVAVPRQRLDLAATRLKPALNAAVHQRRIRLATVGGKLNTGALKSQTARLRDRLDGTTERMHRALLIRVQRSVDRLAPVAARLTAELVRRGIDQRRQRLDQVWKLAGAYSHEGVLERGFALVLDADGHVLRGASQIDAGARLTLAFKDGKVAATADGGAPAKSAPRARSKAAQDDLFGDGGL